MHKLMFLLPLQIHNFKQYVTLYPYLTLQKGVVRKILFYDCGIIYPFYYALTGLDYFCFILHRIKTFLISKIISTNFSGLNFVIIFCMYLSLSFNFELMQ